MNTKKLKKLIKKTKSIKDKGERLLELRDIAEEIANNFTESMSIVEYEIEFVIERTPEYIKKQLGYNEVSDVTKDINVTSSSQY